MASKWKIGSILSFLNSRRMTSDDLAYKISTQDFSRIRSKNVDRKFFEIIWPFLPIDKQKEFLNQVHQMKILFFALELGLELEKIGKFKSDSQRPLNISN